eukprot:COSAG04_NODE_674_length_11272_cov_8.036248_6_plen_696_part_00
MARRILNHHHGRGTDCRPAKRTRDSPALATAMANLRRNRSACMFLTALVAATVASGAQSTAQGGPTAAVHFEKQTWKLLSEAAAPVAGAAASPAALLKHELQTTSTTGYHDLLRSPHINEQIQPAALTTNGAAQRLPPLEQPAGAQGAEGAEAAELAGHLDDHLQTTTSTTDQQGQLRSRHTGAAQRGGGLSQQQQLATWLTGKATAAPGHSEDAAAPAAHLDHGLQTTTYQLNTHGPTAAHFELISGSVVAAAAVHGLAEHAQAAAPPRGALAEHHQLQGAATDQQPLHAADGVQEDGSALPPSTVTTSKVVDAAALLDQFGPANSQHTGAGAGLVDRDLQTLRTAQQGELSSQHSNVATKLGASRLLVAAPPKHTRREVEDSADGWPGVLAGAIAVQCCLAGLATRGKSSGRCWVARLLYGLLATQLAPTRAQQIATCADDYDGDTTLATTGNPFLQAFCEHSTFGGGPGYALMSSLPMAPCGESCTTSIGSPTTAETQACLSISIVGTDHTGGAGTDRRVSCEGTAAACTYQASTSLCQAEHCCICSAGWEGANCGTDIDECDSAPCENAGACQQRVDSYTCTCSAGYDGENCSTDIDECDSTPCENAGACQQGVDSYTCTCSAGYDGENCSVCKASIRTPARAQAPTSAPVPLPPPVELGTKRRLQPARSQTAAPPPTRTRATVNIWGTPG